MALAQTSLTGSQWTLIGNNVSSITFQVISATPVYIGIGTSSSSTASGITSTTPGLVYQQFEGEVKKLVADLSHLTSPTYVFARSLSSIATISYETP
jgi:hypothetical protein